MTVYETQQPTVVAESGEKCPVSGMWKILGNFTTTQSISKEEQMPKYCGKKVIWFLLYPC